MNVLDLFSGIGGFSLGLERAGMRTVAFCEVDPFCRQVLAKHWPNVPCYDDIRTLTADRLRADGISVDVICGGFPCQDISIAQGNARAGLDGERSGLWSSYARIIGELRPRYVIVENVTGLLSLGMGIVLRDLAAIRFSAEWHCISAGSVGAPHIRDRIWLVGYPDSDSEPTLAIDDEMAGMPGLAPDAASTRLEVRPRIFTGGTWAHAATAASHEWDVEPDVDRVVDGFPDRMDRVASLGNAVVPQIPEIIGRAIMSTALTSADCKP